MKHQTSDYKLNFKKWGKNYIFDLLTYKAEIKITEVADLPTSSLMFFHFHLHCVSPKLLGLSSWTFCLKSTKEHSKEDNYFRFCQTSFSHLANSVFDKIQNLFSVFLIRDHQT